jgi:hypothetical protein
MKKKNTMSPTRHLAASDLKMLLWLILTAVSPGALSGSPAAVVVLPVAAGPSPAPALVNLVVPTNMVTEDSAFGSGTLRRPHRIQLAYGSAQFPTGALAITELRFRPDYSYGEAFSTVLQNLEIRLSTTTRAPDGLHTAFTENVGEDETVGFSGPLQISSAFAGPPTGPKVFDIVIPLTTPFVYTPAVGNLLVDIFNFHDSAASRLSGQGRGDDLASRVVGDVSAASGSTDSGAEAMQLVYYPTNGSPLPPPRLSRGPYLQSATTSNIVVRWRTSRAADSRVQFGLAPAALVWEVRAEQPTTEHAMTLTNLAPDTRYFYAVGTRETSLAGGADCFFFTHPLGPRPTRIWALSDYGTTGTPYGFEENAAGVRDAYAAYAASRPADVWLTLGDNSQGGGTDAEYQSQVFDVYGAFLRRMAVWPTIGNHDAAYYPARFDYLNVFSPPTEGEAGGVASHTKHYYSFDFGGIHFLCLDAVTTAPRSNQVMLDWVEQDLSANMKDWVLAYWHCPPYTFGTHNSDEAADTWGRMVDMREVVLPILEAYGVDLVLCGHSHVYERSYLLDGHYGYSSSLVPTMIRDSGSGQPGDTGAYRKAGSGPTPRQGTVYVVAGVGGWVTPLIWGLPDHHPAMRFRLRERGSMIIDVDGNRLDAVFLLETGAVGDRFTIVKGGEPEPLRIATFRLGDEDVRIQWKSVAAQTYRVERASRLENPDWQRVSGAIVATGATTGWTNATPPGTERSFYRVVRAD